MLDSLNAKYFVRVYLNLLSYFSLNNCLVYYSKAVLVASGIRYVIENNLRVKKIYFPHHKYILCLFLGEKITLGIYNF